MASQQLFGIVAAISFQSNFESRTMKITLTREVSRFRKDVEGGVAIIFGLLAIPIVMFVGIAVDYSRVVAADRDLQEAVDAAALAAALYKLEKKSSSSRITSDGEITQDQGKSTKQVALDYVRENSALRYMQNIIPDARDSDDDNSLTVEAKAEVLATFARLVVDKFDIQAKAKVRAIGKAAPLCLMGLNKSAPDTVKAWGTADLIAPDCAVVSNSSSSEALVTGGTAKMVAAAFCTAGNASGSGFTPRPKEKCRHEQDPYAGTLTPAALSEQGLEIPGNCDETKLVLVKQDTNVTFNADGGVYTFCNGIKIQAGATVTFGPGVYVVFGQLYINSQGTLKATDGTTIVLGDRSWGGGASDGWIYVSGGGNLLLTAPTTGPTASMAVIQPSISSYTGDPDLDNEHTLIGGGTIEIVGNWYTPQSKTRITGNGVMNSTSSYFSLISDMVELEGNGELHITAGGDPSSVGMSAIPGRLSYGQHVSLVE
jgi:Flp pilus assembly protein TadG